MCSNTYTSYLGTVPKAKVPQAVREAVCTEAAVSLEGLKKGALIAQAQRHLHGNRWLPSMLRAKG